MKVALIVDIADDININNIEIDYYVYNIKNHDIPFGKELLKVGGIVKPKMLPLKKMHEEIFYANGEEYLKTNAFSNYEKGWNDCLEELGCK